MRGGGGGFTICHICILNNHHLFNLLQVIHEMIKSDGRDITLPPHAFLNFNGGIQFFFHIYLYNAVPHRSIWPISWCFNYAMMAMKSPHHCHITISHMSCHVTAMCHSEKGDMDTQKGQIHLSCVLALVYHVIVSHLSIPSKLSMSS